MKRAFGLVILLVLCACHTQHSTAPTNFARLEASSRAAAQGFERYYQAENDGAVDAYIERSKRRGVSAGRTETCHLPNGAPSSRPTVIANPPISASSIRQRVELVATIGAYLGTLAALAENADADVLSASLSSLKSRTSALLKAANQHAQGDLFIDEAANSLAKAVDGLREEQRSGVASREIVQVDAIVRRLLAILAADAARQRVATGDATKLAYGSWLENQNGSAARERALGPPFCSEPTLPKFANDPSEAALAAVPTDPTGKRLRERLKAASAADPTAVVTAMAALDDDEMQSFVNHGRAATAEKAASGREAFEHAAAIFAGSVPTPLSTP